jgi:hypothetical protein
VKIGRELDKVAACRRLFKLYSEYLTKEAFEGFGNFRIGGQVIRTVKYADGLVLLAKEEMVLQGMIDRLIEIGRHYGTEILKKTNVMRISRQPYPIEIMIDQKQLAYVEYFNYLGSMIIMMQGVHVKLKPELPWQKQHSARRRLFSPANWT